MYTLITNQEEEGEVLDCRTTYFSPSELVAAFLRRAPLISRPLVDFLLKYHKQARSEALAVLTDLKPPIYVRGNY